MASVVFVQKMLESCENLDQLAIHVPSWREPLADCLRLFTKLSLLYAIIDVGAVRDKCREWAVMLGWEGIKVVRLEGTHNMTITEIVLNAAEFQTLIDTLEAGLKHVEDEENYSDEQRHRGITLTGILKKMSTRNALYTLRCKVSEP